MDNNHHHKPIFRSTYPPGENLDFHPKLREWLEQYWELTNKDTLTVQESGCDDSSCPVYETIILCYAPGSDTPRILKLGKPKHLIAKMDIFFSCQKQK